MGEDFSMSVHPAFLNQVPDPKGFLSGSARPEETIETAPIGC